MSNFWRRYFCRIGFHWWKFVETGTFAGNPFLYSKERCKFCGKEGYTPEVPQ